jgi:hypothetical protein
MINLRKRYIKSSEQYENYLSVGKRIGIPIILSLFLSTITAFVITSCIKKDSETVILTFCEYSQIELDREKVNEKVDSLTSYLCSVNDSTMKIFEAWSIANNRNSWNIDKTFATELEFHTVRSYKTHKRNFTDLTEIGGLLMVSAADLLKKLEPLHRSMNHLFKLESSLDKSWTEDHTDYYRTEYYTDTECSTDSKGNQSCRTVTKSRQVYDYTIHEYWYHLDYGNSSIYLLESFINDSSFDIPFLEKELKPASQTNAEGEWAQEWTKKKKGIEFHIESSSWITNSTYLASITGYRSNINTFPRHLSLLKSASSSAQSYYKYKTYSSVDSGPDEYQVFQSAGSNVSSAILHAHNILNSISSTIQSIRTLSDMIDEYISYELDDGKKEVVAMDIVELSGKIYSQNFVNGQKITVYRSWYFILIYIFSAMVIYGIIMVIRAKLKGDW